MIQKLHYDNRTGLTINSMDSSKGSLPVHDRLIRKQHDGFAVRLQTEI